MKKLLGIILIGILASGCAMLPEPDDSWNVIKPTNWIGWGNQPPVPRAVSVVTLVWEASDTYVDGTVITNSVTFTLYGDESIIGDDLTNTVYSVELPPPPAHKISFTVTQTVVGDGWESDPSVPKVIKKSNPPKGWK